MTEETKPKHPGGRPPKFTDPNEFDRLVNEYLDDCVANEEPLTITGLTLHLGFCDKCSLYEYGQREGFEYSVKRARLLVENGYEKRLREGSGVIFALKNFGWSDSQNINLGGQPENPVKASIAFIPVGPND